MPHVTFHNPPDNTFPTVTGCYHGLNREVVGGVDRKWIVGGVLVEQLPAVILTGSKNNRK